MTPGLLRPGLLRHARSRYAGEDPRVGASHCFHARLPSGVMSPQGVVGQSQRGGFKMSLYGTYSSHGGTTDRPTDQAWCPWRPNGENDKRVVTGCSRGLLCLPAEQKERGLADVVNQTDACIDNPRPPQFPRGVEALDSALDGNRS